MGTKRRWTAMDADFCRAVAAATLGDGEKIRFKPLFASVRFPALKANQIDLLACNTTQTACQLAVSAGYVMILFLLL